MYRYRSLKSILDYNELSEHNLYFSNIEEDKHEGYINYYWKGDKIVWQNLISHFYWTFSELIVLDTDYPYENGMYVDSNFQFFGEKYNENRMGLNYLLRDDIVSNFLKNINNNVCVNISELKFIFIVTSSISLNSYEKYVQDLYNSKKFEHETKDDTNFVDIIGALKDSDENEILSLYYKYQLSWSKVINKVFKNKSEKFKQIMSDFPENYINNICDIIKPNFYIASFSNNPNDEVMWTNYADSNEGVCLEFNSNKYLNLFAPYVFSENGNKCKYIPFNYKKIEYNSKPVDLNFFENIGNIQGRYSTSFLMDKNGKKSISYHNVYDDLDSWRNKYWKSLQNAYNKKMKKWNFEDEYRLVLPEMLDVYKDKKDRIFKYNVNDLKSITFGENIPQDKKIKIINIIKNIKKNDLKNFSFYQQTVNSHGQIVRVKY